MELPSSEMVLSSEQEQIMAICRAQVDYLNNNRGNPSKLVLVQGVAGSGKSTVIKSIVGYVQQQLGPESIKVTAPTGVAALNINGQTIHSLMHIVKFDTFEPLTGVNQNLFIERMRQVRILIVDEVSMVGAKLLYFMDQRCKEIRTANRGELFGGIIVYLFGDFRQLPPVAQAPLYHVHWNNMDCVSQGRLIFNQFRDKFELRLCLRQQGPEQATFRAILGRLWKGSCTIEDHQLLMQRRKAVLSVAEIQSFDTAFHLYTTNKACTAENNRQLAKLGVPVARIVSVNMPGIPLDENESQMGLNHVLNLAVGCRVMLRANIWVEGGLVNSSMGTVRAIVYGGQDLPPKLPLYAMVEFDDYKGPYFPGTNKLFPIKPISRSLTKNGRTFVRTQLPLSLGYAFTIHKCQGLTLPKIIVDLGNSEKTAGLTYVALSRVKRLEDIMFERSFPLTRITTSIANAFGQKEREELINQISRDSILN